MGARPSSFKKAGGLFNNVEGVITGYEFTTDTPWEGGKKSSFSQLFFKVSARMDGADEDTEQHLFAGDADKFEISKDGLTLTPVEEGMGLGSSTNFARFIQSLCDNGFPESALSDDEAEITYEPIIGTRCRFMQEVDAALTKKLGKRKDKKTGKEYDRTYTVVSDVLSLPGTSAKTKRGSAPVASKANGKSKATVEEVDIDEEAKVTLLSLVESSDGSIARSRLSARGQILLSKNANRKAILDRMIDPAFLKTEDGWAYDGKTVSADE